MNGHMPVENLLRAENNQMRAKLEQMAEMLKITRTLFNVLAHREGGTLHVSSEDVDAFNETGLTGAMKVVPEGFTWALVNLKSAPGAPDPDSASDAGTDASNPESQTPA